MMEDIALRLCESKDPCGICVGLLQQVDVRPKTCAENIANRVRAVVFEGHLERMHGWIREENLVE